MINIFKRKPVLSESEKLAIRKKEAVFNAVKNWPIGTKMSKDDMKEYIQASCDYRSWTKTLYIEMSLIRFREFVLVEIELEKIPVSDKVCSINREHHENSLRKISLYKKMFQESNWSPPIIFDVENNSIIDGAHRVEGMKLAGVDKIPCFVGVEYYSYSLLNKERYYDSK